MNGSGDHGWARAAVGLGSNLGDRLASLTLAAAALERHDRVRGLARSGIYETAPVGPAGQGAYLNAAVTLETDFGPSALLELLLSIEIAGGRYRTATERWGPRTIDLDVLLYADRVIDEPGLRVPHPRMTERAFVLAPLREIAGAWMVPGDGRAVNAAWSDLESSGQAVDVELVQPASARGWASL